MMLLMLIRGYRVEHVEGQRVTPFFEAVRDFGRFPSTVTIGKAMIGREAGGSSRVLTLVDFSMASDLAHGEFIGNF